MQEKSLKVKRVKSKISETKIVNIIKKIPKIVSVGSGKAKNKYDDYDSVWKV